MCLLFKPQVPSRFNDSTSSLRTVAVGQGADEHPVNRKAPEEAAWMIGLFEDHLRCEKWRAGIFFLQGLTHRIQRFAENRMIKMSITFGPMPVPDSASVRYSILA